MRLPVRAVIFFYIFICVVLLLFNLLYIFRSGSVKRRQKQRIQRWETYLDSFLEGSPVWDSGELLRRLKDTEELTAFFTAMESRKDMQPEEAVRFFQENRPLILELAGVYQKKDAMEQAFFAYVIASFYPPVGDKGDPLAEQLLSYLDGSTVYSRENVLNALSALGSAQSVEHAFILMSQRGWYHDPRLLSDGLTRFQGDQDALANRLWKNRRQLSECFQVGLIRFADTLSGDSFAENFLKALETEQFPAETRFALVRYFRRHPIPYAKPVLLQLLKGDSEGKRDLSIAAAASLAAYPDGETRQALKDALHSQNWYVRQNAARSLKTMGVTWEEVRTGSGGDRYAADMLEYIFEVPSATAGLEKEREALATV